MATAPPSEPELAEVYRAHFQFVWRSLRRLGGRPEQLEDMAQDVFLVVARRLDDFKAQSSIRTWLFAIAAHVVRTHRRSAFRHSRRVEAYAKLPPRCEPDPMSRREASQLLAVLLDQLDEAKRAVYVLVELEGLTAVEVANGYGVNVNTIYTRLRAARKQLQQAAQAHLESQGDQHE